MVMTTAPITAQGADETGRPLPGLTPDVLKTAFALSSGGESELIEIGKGEYYAVKVEKVIPAALPPLDSIKPQLTQVWLQNEMGKRMQAKADALAARVKKGESLDAVAASAGDQGPARRRHQPRERPAASGPGPRPPDGHLRRQAGRGVHLARRSGGHRRRQAGNRASGRTRPDGPITQALRPQTIDQGLMRDLGETVRQAPPRPA
jgi:peptidyl-prolyl cis-trans isomerase D